MVDAFCNRVVGQLKTHGPRVLQRRLAGNLVTRRSGSCLKEKDKAKAGSRGAGVRATAACGCVRVGRNIIAIASGR